MWSSTQGRQEGQHEEGGRQENMPCQVAGILWEDREGEDMMREAKGEDGSVIFSGNQISNQY